MRVHVIQTGTLRGNETFMRADGWSSLLRRVRPFDFPVYAYILEHPDGLIAIDTGLNTATRTPRPARRFVPFHEADPSEEIGPAMRAAGLRPEDVRTVILTHLDWDHAGGLAHFPNAEFLVPRGEFEFAATTFGKIRYQPKLWPEWFSPTLVDLDDEPYGPFPQSKRVFEDIVLVPMPGHSIAQVGVVVPSKGVRLLFGGDHILRQDWFLDDYAAGKRKGLGLFFPEDAVKTSERIHGFVAAQPTVLLPSHDAEAAGRLAALEPLRV